MAFFIKTSYTNALIEQKNMMAVIHCFSFPQLYMSQGSMDKMLESRPKKIKPNLQTYSV